MFLGEEMTEGGFDEKLNILNKSVRDKCGSKMKRLNSVCKEQRERNRRRQQKNLGSDLHPAIPEHLRRGKLTPGFHRV